MALDRNGLEIIEVDDCWQLLEAHHIGRLAVCIAGRPEIFPLNFVVDRDRDGRPSLVFLTSPGTKLAGAVLGASAVFEIDSADPMFHTGWSVVVHGEATEIDTTDELEAVASLPLRPWGPGAKRNYVRLVPTEVGGRRILNPVGG